MDEVHAGRTPVLRVRLFGGMDLRVDDVSVPPLESQRAESLLAFLLLHPDTPQLRQHLAFRLWPDSTETQARTNLRHVLHNLRRGFPDADHFIEVRSRTLHWRMDASTWIDVAAFEQAIAGGRLIEAVQIYTGELMAGCYDEWLTTERERLSSLHIDALARLVRRLDDDGRRPEAIEYAERLVRSDPLNEDMYRRLIRLYDAGGDRAKALRTYHVCAATLRRELHTEPSAATRAAYDALLTGTHAPAAPAHVSGSVATPELVGRAAERARLCQLWRAAQRGVSHLALITGEPGIGKTRLAEGLRAWCERGGAVTVEGRAYPVEGPMAFGLLASWLRSPPIMRGLRRLDHTQLTELARVLPNLPAQRPHLPQPGPLPGDEQRRRLFDAAAALHSAGAPLLLVADDIQWADVQSLQFIHYLSRTRPDARRLIVATARREDLIPRGPVGTDTETTTGNVLAGLAALGSMTEIELQRLSREETTALARRLSRHPLSDVQLDQLYAASEGNPLFIEEAVRAATHAGVTPDRISPKIHTLIAIRLGYLGAPATHVASVAATIGREFTVPVLATACDLPEQAFVHALDELWRRGIIRSQTPSTYDFSHGKIRDVAYAMLGPVQARHHHLRVARALERMQGDHLVPGQIAAHLDNAGEPAAAVNWYVQAAESAQRLHAHHDAVSLLERARRLLSTLPADDRSARLELDVLTAIPAPLVAVEGYFSSRLSAAHERALELTRRLSLEPEPRLVRSLALARLSRGEFAAAEPYGLQLRTRADNDGDEVLWVESAYVLGVAAFWQGRLHAAREHFARAIERCRPEHRASHLLHYGQDPEAFCGLRLGYTWWLMGDDSRARHCRDRALAEADRSSHAFTVASTTAWAALLALDQHNDNDLRKHAAALMDRPGTAEATPTRIFAEALLGFLDILDGRAQSGLRRIRRALADASAGEPSAPGLVPIHARILVEACARAGDAASGLAAADEAIELCGAARLWEAEIRRLRAGFRAALGAPRHTVEAELANAFDIAQRQGARAYVARTGHDLALLHSATQSAPA